MEVIPNTRAVESGSIREGRVNRAEQNASTSLGSLYSRVVDIDDLTSLQTDKMYKLFSDYYQDHSKFQFLEDLFEKTKVILLFENKFHTIQGFSTLLEFEQKHEGMVYTGVYSGDTVVSKSFWGTPQLGIAFLKYLWKLKVRRPLQPLYWFLISKGYKTYLLMANNFDLHFPRFERSTDNFHRGIMDKFYGEKFAKSFDSESMRIRPSEDSCKLKPDVACIKEKYLSNPRIAFFQEKNPRWSQGEELCCVAKMTLLMPLKYSLKKLFKGIVGRKLGRGF